MRQTIAALIAGIALVTGCTNEDDWTRGYEPCATEDAEGPCYWDAEERGNGRGTSFVVEPDGTTVHVNR